jgi:hypothetical protein
MDSAEGVAAEHKFIGGKIPRYYLALTMRIFAFGIAYAFRNMQA